MKNLNSETKMFGEVQLSYNKKVEFPYCSLSNSSVANEVIRSIMPESTINYREHVYALYLNVRHVVVGYHHISTGGISQASVDMRGILQGALLSNASGMIIFHNHPSGNTTPSTADKVLTDKIKIAGELLNIKLLDHLVIGEKGFYSFADEGVL